MNYKSRMADSVRTILISVSLVCFPMSAAADFFIGYGITNVAIGGDFDNSGNEILTDGSGIIIIPNMPTDGGSKFSLGSHSRRGTFEFSVETSDHDGEWAGFIYPVEFQSINFDYKFRGRGRGTAHGFGVFGFGLTNLTVEDGSSDGFVVKDAKYKGFDVRFGGGLGLVAHRNFIVDLQALYRFGSYNSADGAISGSIDDISGDGLTLSIEAKFIFDSNRKK